MFFVAFLQEKKAGANHTKKKIRERTRTLIERSFSLLLVTSGAPDAFKNAQRSLLIKKIIGSESDSKRSP